MKDAKNIQISNRFFYALEQIIAKKELRGVQTFTTRYGLDKRNLYKIKNQPEIFTLKPSLLAILVEDFSVSALWLLTGKGDIFVKKA